MLVPKLRFKREDGTEYPEWENSKISKHAKLYNGDRGKNYPSAKDYVSNGVPFINAGDLDGLNISESCAKISIDKYNQLGGAKLLPNDILYCLRGSLGKKGIVRFSSGGTVASSLVAIRAIDIYYMYLFYFLCSDAEYKQRILCDEGAAQPNLSAQNVGNYDIQLPCLEEQQKIADFLSTVDEVIAQSEAEVQNLEQQKKAAMQKIFSQEVRFKREDGLEYPEWEEKNISDICESIVGGGTPTTENKEYWNGSIAWVSSSDLQNDNIHYLSVTRFITEDAIIHSATKLIPQNSVLIVSRVGVGKVVVAPCQLCTSQDFTNLVNPQCNSVFLAYLLSVIMQKKANGVQGTSIKGITAKEIKMYDVSIPCLEEQQKIADFLSAYDEAISYAKQELDKWKELKKGLLQQMFV